MKDWFYSGEANCDSLRSWEQFPHATSSRCLLVVASLSSPPVVNHCILLVFVCPICPIWTMSVLRLGQEVLSVSGKTLPSLSISLTKHTQICTILPMSSERQHIFQSNINFTWQLKPSSHSYANFRRQCHFTPATPWLTYALHCVSNPNRARIRSCASFTKRQGLHTI